MKKQDLEKKITENSLKKYNGNLAAILIFGSYNTGQFVFGVSDIDAIILFKERNSIDFENEKYELGNSLVDIKLKILHFKTLRDYEEHIYNKGSWSSWITVIKGSKILYSTPEFEDFKKKLANNPISKEKLKKYLQDKDKFELEGYLRELSGWNLTKGLFSHIRRKLQILNYHQGNKLNFDYDACLENLRDINNKKDLAELSGLYDKRESVSEKRVSDYFKIARLLTEKINNIQYIFPYSSPL